MSSAPPSLSARTRARPAGGREGEARVITRLAGALGGSRVGTSVLRSSLSIRLLALTSAFAVAVAAIILVQSATAFHERWLLDRIRAAEMASVGVEALPYNLVEEDTAQQLLEIGGVSAVVVGEEGVRRLLLRAPAMAQAPDLIDFQTTGLASRMIDPWRTLLGPEGRVLRVKASPTYRSGDYIEILVPAAPLREDLGAHLTQMLLISALIALGAGGLLYFALSIMVLSPVRRLTQSIARFRADPEAEPHAGEDDAGRLREDEIGQVERELSRMQAEVRRALRSRARLAALGEAVAKINHDLRNMLTSAQMASERLAMSGDPEVMRALPRLERALDRALSLARNVLEYGKAAEPEPAKRKLSLNHAVTAAAEDAGLMEGGVRLIRKIAPRYRVHADPEQLHRMLVNLMRNAREAIEADEAREGRGIIRLEATCINGQDLIRVADDGPGVPERLRERLFQPFSSTRRGGTGLGLAISSELASNHGGELSLVDTGPLGTIFELRLPSIPESPALKAPQPGSAQR